MIIGDFLNFFRYVSMEIKMKRQFLKAMALVGAILYVSPAWSESEVGLYGWATDVSGQVSLGRLSVPVEVDFATILDNADTTLQFYALNRGEQWGGGVDVTFLDSSKSTSVGALTNEFTLIDFFGSYRLSENSDLIGGIRNLDMDTTLDIAGLATANSNITVTDAFVGFKTSAPMSENWEFNLRVDLGAGDSDLVTHALIGVRRNFSNSTSIRIGYRYLDYDFQGMRRGIPTNVDLQYSGPAIGLSVVF
ncbi:MAG: hypothetical protein ACI909_002656 [Planctomycetota bacterium]